MIWIQSSFASGTQLKFFHCFYSIFSMVKWWNSYSIHNIRCFTPLTLKVCIGFKHWKDIRKYQDKKERVKAIEYIHVLNRTDKLKYCKLPTERVLYKMCDICCCLLFSFFQFLFVFNLFNWSLYFIFCLWFKWTNTCIAFRTNTTKRNMYVYNILYKERDGKNSTMGFLFPVVKW